MNVFEEFLTPAWLQKADSILVGGPEPAESLGAITSSQEQCLDPGSLGLIWITIQGGEDWVGARQRKEAGLEVLERRKSSTTGEFRMPIFLNFLLAQLLEFIFGDWVLKKEERVRKLVLDGEVSYILDPGLGSWLGLD